MTNSKVGAKIPVKGNFKHLHNGIEYDYNPKQKTKKQTKK